MAKPRRNDRLGRKSAPSVSWKRPPRPDADQMVSNVAIDMGWGRLIFGQTFGSSEKLAETLCQEQPGQRDIALYLRDPHVVLSYAPQELFLDPSHTYRLWSHSYRPSRRRAQAFVVRRLTTREDAQAANRIYAARNMVTCDEDFLVDQLATRLRTFLVAEEPGNGRVIGTVMGVDHVEAFNDPENGSSLWCLAVDPQATTPGVGEALSRSLAEHYFARGRDYMDLSVMHDNSEAIRLYEKLGFQRVPVFCVKHKNPINEPLFIAPQLETELNPYAQIIVDEARRRGIEVEVMDQEQAYFRLTFGGRSILCRESLSQVTTAVAMSLCDHKRLTNKLLAEAGLQVPKQQVAAEQEENEAFLEAHGRLVVKPARGEQGAGVSVDVRSPDELEEAISAAGRVCTEVLLEEYVEGQDLRIVVIDYEPVAAAVRRPPRVTGNGQHTARQLIEKYSRRRAAATGGESRVPLDAETERCLKEEGFELESVLPTGADVTVRKAANLHTGGTIHDVTPQLHPELASVASKAARVLDIPVVGLDLLVPDPEGPDYVIIEANERPGLANHEPQPTAERFIDLLFPQTVAVQP